MNLLLVVAPALSLGTAAEAAREACEAPIDLEIDSIKSAMRSGCAAVESAR